jgi:multiple sugar transport system ATP-binding protein
MAHVELKNVKKSFDALEVIKGVDLEVNDREFVVIVGPSGCGKSTLLRMIAGLEDVTSGQVLIDGLGMTNVEPAKRGLAMVFQSYALYPHMSVADNMGFALRLAGVPREERRAKVLAAAKILQLEPLLERKPGQLSGGQRQRVAIGRAIVRNPKVFLFDEPLSNLDAALRVQMRVELAKLRRDLEATIIYVTHDQVEAMTMADKIVVLDKGAIEQIGSPLELYSRPNSLFVARFIGSPTMNFLAGAPAAKRGAATIGVRPEHLRLSTASGEWPATVRIAEHLGSDTFVYVDAADAGVLTVRVDGDAPHRPGDAVYLTPQERHVHKFDKDGKRIG